jgi:PAS domain S-box-containing protein
MADGTPLLTNKAFMDIFGVEPPPGYNVLKDDILRANGMLALFERAFAGETVQVPTFWFDPRQLTTFTVTEGRAVAISMTIFPLFKATGEIEYVAATYKDETALVTAAEQLRASEERAGMAQQAARVGIFEWNLQTNVNTWTPELEAIYGLAPGEFGATQKSWEDLVHPDDLAAAVARVEAALASGEPVEGEWRVVWPDGSIHWVFGRFQAHFAAGKPHRVVGANIDITARKRAEAALRESEALAAEAEIHRREKEAAQIANAELEAFSYSVAHDLRAPLRAINGFSNVLLEDHAANLDEEARLHLNRIAKGATRMGALIDALLSLAKIARQELRYQLVDLGRVARDVIAQLEGADRPVEWVIADRLEVRGDPTLLHSVMQNLVGNAWKFTAKQDRARIEVGSSTRDGVATYFVKDDGPGFSQESAEKLFRPFGRLHRADEFEGTGIGLATVERIIRRHGGRVWADAEVGGGATFYFTLPR